MGGAVFEGMQIVKKLTTNGRYNRAKYLLSVMVVSLVANVTAIVGSVAGSLVNTREIPELFISLASHNGEIEMNNQIMIRFACGLGGALVGFGMSLVFVPKCLSGKWIAITVGLISIIFGVVGCFAGSITKNKLKAIWGWCEQWLWWSD